MLPESRKKKKKKICIDDSIEIISFEITSPLQQPCKINTTIVNIKEQKSKHTLMI